MTDRVVVENAGGGEPVLRVWEGTSPGGIPTVFVLTSFGRMTQEYGKPSGDRKMVSSERRVDRKNLSDTELVDAHWAMLTGEGAVCSREVHGTMSGIRWIETVDEPVGLPDWGDAKMGVSPQRDDSAFGGPAVSHTVVPSATVSSMNSTVDTCFGQVVITDIGMTKVFNHPVPPADALFLTETICRTSVPFERVTEVFGPGWNETHSFTKKILGLDDDPLVALERAATGILDDPRWETALNVARAAAFEVWGYTGNEQGHSAVLSTSRVIEQAVSKTSGMRLCTNAPTYLDAVGIALATKHLVGETGRYRQEHFDFLVSAAVEVGLV